MKRLAVGVGKSVLTTLIFFIAAELALRGAYAARNSMVRLVPLPYALGDEYGPIPPWLDRLMILVPDDTTIWRNLPNVRRTYVDIFSPAQRTEDRVALLRQFVPTLPPQFRGNPTWTIALNSFGYRSPEPKRVRLPSTLRIACVGDSWTFGMNVDQDRTYPSRLGEQLQHAHPDRTIEVLNFGVLGYSSFQGLQLMKARVLDLHPDVVAIGFGMNDSEVAGYRDKDMVTLPRPGMVARARASARAFEVYKLLDYLALTLKFHPKSIGDYLSEEASAEAAGTVDYSTIEPWTRVSPVDYETNVREMTRLATGAGARVVLVDNELWDGSPYRPVLRRIAADTHAALVDSLAIIDAARKQTERDIEKRLNLIPANESSIEPTPPASPASPASPAPPAPPASRTTVVFRVSHGAFPVSGAMSIAGNGAELGAYAPNMVKMRDDGLEGDERANDGVWSYRATFPPGTRLFYVYTNSGARGRWEGLDVPHIRQVVVPAVSATAPVYLPIETFGRVYMQADNWHTDATGYELIAEAVAHAIEQQ